MSLSLDTRRPMVFFLLCCAIVGWMWWLADAKARFDASQTLAIEYARPVPGALARIESVPPVVGRHLVYTDGADHSSVGAL